MAPAELSPSFQKLKLDTRHSQKPIPSTFASIRRSHAANPAQAFPDSGGPTFWHANNSSSTLTEAELAASPYGDHEPVAYGQDSDWQEQAIANGGSSALEASFRDRHTSISFDNKVTLDSGNRLPLNAPLPKPFPIDDHFNPQTGQLLDRGRTRMLDYYRAGESRYPLEQDTVDELAQGSQLEDQDQVASLTSGATMSTTADEVCTPLEHYGEYMESPLAASSPVDLPSHRSSSGAWPLSRRTSSVRSRMSLASDKGGSMRRTGRRSTRSNQSSMSPATAFLSQWGKEEASTLLEPDDEGQEIPGSSGYFIGKQIGFGGFSVVKEVSTIEQGAKVIRAVKIVRKNVDGKDETENEKLQQEFEHEVEIWRYLKHPYILPLLAVYEAPFATFCITHLNTGGTLFDLVRARRKASANKSVRSAGLPSALAKRYLYQLASALRYLHEDVRVVHRDVKLENCLLDMSSPSAAIEGGNVLLCDFGMADFITNEHRSPPSTSPLSETPNPIIGPSETSTCVAGSMEYAAPELLGHTAPTSLYSPAVDIWAFGVVAYALLTGSRPFSHSFQPALVMMITKGEWNEGVVRAAIAAAEGWEVGEEEEKVEEALVLLRGCLEKDTQLRWTIADVLECRWLEGCRELYEDVWRDWMEPM
ncbi:kinase-like protein [Saccharata proteae CBS 121410]|uniref:Kinase-like protein n=1 Tax=Saccharata proteae CBS 121410 TaxID=1314787 RepID=A0A9P4M0E6_9PEZI|nr:kinase-like protein [Saccharata proteae CBS 121410]